MLTEMEKRSVYASLANDGHWTNEFANRCLREATDLEDSWPEVLAAHVLGLEGE